MTKEANDFVETRIRTFLQQGNLIPEEIEEQLRMLRNPFDRAIFLNNLTRARPEILLNGRAQDYVHKRLYDLIEEARTLSTKDPLTGLFNRASLYEEVEIHKREYHRTQKPFAVLLMDIDFFKRINDTYGHYGGDAVLKNFANLLSENFRPQDKVFRYGGEEFLALLPDSTKNDGAEIAATRVKSKLERMQIPEIPGLRVTVTIGVSSYPQDPDFIKSADLALYKGKEAGRNRIVTYRG
jgi:diguanylate cyclase (GGDEF)-like protein